ncbi:methyltransferase domain-containing protein [bacterium]|nr:methyltransferase domain-containing protein [bacterium]
MINKEVVYKKFGKRIDDYSENAVVQKQMAKKLVSLLPRKQFSSVLEIGSYTGFLTREISQNIDYNSYLAIDVVEKSGEYLKKIDDKIEFQKCDIENFETKQKFDLIISNASLQWCSDFEGIIKKLLGALNNGGVLAISIFSPDNLKEIKEVFGVSLNYPDETVIKKVFGENSVIFKDEISLKFDSPLDVLRHLKYTGVNSLNDLPMGYCRIKEALNILNDRFDNTLTYYPIYIKNERKL